MSEKLKETVKNSAKAELDRAKNLSVLFSAPLAAYEDHQQSSKVRSDVQQAYASWVELISPLTVQLSEAARSGAYLYPIRGVLYFVTHKDLWRPLMAKLAPTLGLAASIIAGMFFFTYLPQLAVLTFTDGPLAPVSAALLVLSESSTLFNVLSKSFVIDEALIDTFDGTLVARGMTGLVSQGRQVNPGGDAIAKLGKLVKKPFEKYSPSAIIRYLMYLPLNLIPGIGTLLFIILQGKRYGPSSHQRYFQLKGWSATQREGWIEEHRGAYTSFGIPAALLETIPLAQVFFAFTNTVGAGLWAADLEQQSTTAPGLRRQAKQTR